MNDFTIDTTSDIIRQTPPKCRDPYDHLGPVEWVDQQIAYGSQPEHISGRGLIPVLDQLQGERLIGCEIGVCNGFTTEYLLTKNPRIQMIHAIDPYPSFVDWDGTRITAERQAEIKRRCLERLNPFASRVTFHFQRSSEIVSQFSDGELDFVFIDGDHSYNATLADLRAFWPKVRSGGVFSGHDVNLSSVSNALDTFLKEIDNSQLVLQQLENTAWGIIKP